VDKAVFRRSLLALCGLFFSVSNIKQAIAERLKKADGGKLIAIYPVQV
jgi:hypothetical protein